MISGSGEIGAKCVHMYALAGPVTSIRLTSSFHTVIVPVLVIAFPGIQPNIVMPIKLLLSLMLECRGSTGQFQWLFGVIISMSLIL